jgi:hypothetical protein
MMPNSTGARYLDAPLPQLPHLPHDQVPCDEALLKTKTGETDGLTREKWVIYGDGTCVLPERIMIV